MISLAALLLLGVAQAGITKDTDMNHMHGDPKEYVRAMREKQPLNAHFVKSGNPLTVHVIPHSHDDVGWLKTVDEYFTGNQYEIQIADVEIILDTVMKNLILDKKKHYSQVEMKFFSMWWSTQTESLKNQVRQLVQEGRLEFLNAGWSMSDEAAPHFDDFIDNMMKGHDFLLKEFGVKPRIAWHIDPFGHSNASPRLFADMGFDAWFFARMDYQDKARRLNTSEMEWVWRPFFNHEGKRTQIFTHTLYQHYSSPKGFDFDTKSSDDPIIDDPEMQGYNVNEKVQELRDWIDHQVTHYKAAETGHLFMVFGDDFRWCNAYQYFKSLDKLIYYFNQAYSDVQLQYSTPSKYIDAISSNGNQNIAWPTKYDDMFPYADTPESFWSGYFTSRANAKGYVRRGS